MRCTSSAGTAVRCVEHLGVPVAGQRVEPEPVLHGVDDVDRVRVGAGLGQHGDQVQDDPDRGVGAHVADPVGGQRPAQQQVVRRQERGGRLAATRCVDAAGVAQERRAPRLVVRRPDLHAVGQPLGDQAGVVGEAVRGVARRPAAGVLEGLREVPVVQRRQRLHAAREQRVDEALVVVQPGGVRGAATGRLHPRPGDREAVAVHAERLDQREVLLAAVVGVARGRAVAAVEHRAGPAAEGVPDRVAAAVGVDRALDLVGRRRDAEAQGFHRSTLGRARAEDRPLVGPSLQHRRRRSRSPPPRCRRPRPRPPTGTTGARAPRGTPRPSRACRAARAGRPAPPGRTPTTARRAPPSPRRPPRRGRSPGAARSRP